MTTEAEHQHERVAALLKQTGGSSGSATPLLTLSCNGGCSISPPLPFTPPTSLLALPTVPTALSPRARPPDVCLRSGATRVAEASKVCAAERTPQVARPCQEMV